MYIEEVNGYGQILIFSPLAALVYCQVCTLDRTRERNSSERVLLPIGAVEIIVGGPIEDLAFLGTGGPIDVARRGGGGPMDGI